MDLMVSDADGSDPILVASGAEVNGWPQVDWSPDGTRLTYTAYVPGASTEECESDGGTFCGSRVFIAAADGSSGAVQVGDPDLDAREAVWSPDGTSIAFGGGGAEHDIQLHVMDADGSNVRVVSDLQGSTWALFRLDWSPDGSSVVGTSGVPVWDIWAFSVEDGRETNISGPSFGSQLADRFFPAYAADGAIAWSGGWSGEECACLTLREGEADPVVLRGYTDAMAWSPDGQYIVTGQAGRSGELVVINRQGQVQATITDVNGDTASWQDLGS
jgi:Tol biopolymer transport system component